MGIGKEKVGKRETIQDNGINRLFEETVAREPEKHIYKPDGNRDAMHENMLTYKTREIVNYSYILKEHVHSKAALTYKIDGIRDISLSDYVIDVKPRVLKLISRTISDRSVKVKINVFVKYIYKMKDETVIKILQRSIMK